MHHDSDNSSDSTVEQRPFRFNAKVAQFLIIVLLAMGLPIAVAVLGFLEMRKAMVNESAEPLVEPPGLRSALEQAVDAAWQSPATLGGSAGRFVRACPNGEECLRLGDEVQKVALEFKGVVLSPERIEEGGTRWIVTIQAEHAQEFEAVLESLGFRETAPAPQDAQSVLYELEIRIAG